MSNFLDFFSGGNTNKKIVIPFSIIILENIKNELVKLDIKIIDITTQLKEIENQVFNNNNVNEFFNIDEFFNKCKKLFNEKYEKLINNNNIFYYYSKILCGKNIINNSISVGINIELTYIIKSLKNNPIMKAPSLYLYYSKLYKLDNKGSINLNMVEFRKLFEIRKYFSVNMDMKFYEIIMRKLGFLEPPEPGIYKISLRDEFDVIINYNQVNEILRLIKE